jgi:hypothetical protein
MMVFLKTTIKRVMFFKPDKEEDQKKISLMRPMLAKMKTAGHQQIFM